jgi:hypothetical protein
MHNEPFLDTGPMWFVEVLLIYWLVCAGWLSWRQCSAAVTAPSPARPAEPLDGSTLVARRRDLAAHHAGAPPIFPVQSCQVGQAELWQQPQLLAMLGFGIVAAQRHRLDPVLDLVRRRRGLAALRHRSARSSRSQTAPTAAAARFASMFGSKLGDDTDTSVGWRFCRSVGLGPAAPLSAVDA